MSVYVNGLVYRSRFGSTSLKAVALKLADVGDDEGRRIYPSKRTIADHAEVSLATVRRSIRLFLAKGLLVVVQEGGRGPRSTTQYAFNMDILEALSKGPTMLTDLPDVGADVDVDEDQDTCMDSDLVCEIVAPAEASGSESVEARCGQDKGVTLTPLDTHKGVTGTQEGCHQRPLRVSQLDTQTLGTLENVKSGAREDARTAQSDLDQLETALRDAAGDALNAASPGLLILATPQRWLDNGADLQGDVVPAIATRSRTLKPGSVRSWRFFDGVVADWMEQRAAGVDLPALPAKADPSTFSDEDWQRRLDYLQQTGEWGDNWGPAPGQAGCLVPGHLLATGPPRDLNPCG